MRASRDNWLRFAISGGVGPLSNRGCIRARSPPVGIQGFSNRPKRVCFGPKHPGGAYGVDAGVFPPCTFITAAMHLAVVSPAQRHGELVADLAPKCLRLRKPQMMGVRRLTTADQTRLFSDEPDMVLVANATRL